MLNTLNINLKTDIKTDRPTTLPITLMSQDKNNNQFILRFTNGGESVTLDDSYTVEVLTKFTKSGTSRLTTAKVRQDYATWEFDTAYITQDETVYNYVYVRKSGTLVVSADSNAFYFEVGLSEIDKDAGRVAETYDENYEKVLLDYSEALDDRTTERLDEAVAEFNQRGDAEIADWLEGADSELADKVQNFKLKNDLENSGNFTVTTKWDVVTDGTLSVISSELFATVASGQTGVIVRNTTSKVWQTNSKYYCRVSAKVKNAGMSTMRARLGNMTSNLILVGNEVANPVADTLYNIDGLVIPLASNLGNAISLWVSVTGAVGNQIAVKNANIIDLTGIFGIGNEPTLIEMRELIKLIPDGWWDGELSLTQKQYVTWQLNLIRKNTNAIIALGGTII